MNARKVIIDCDPGIDDALALMMAINSDELDILAITVVCGNVPVDVGVKNVLKVLKQMNRLDIPVFQGAEKPLKREFIDAENTHGKDGLGESFFPDVKDTITYAGACDFIHTQLVDAASHDEKISILALGPLTNIAQAVCNDDCFNGLEQLVVMGGSYKSHGNCSPVAEFNFYCDPDSANQVFQYFETKNTPIFMIGLDVTRHMVLTPNILAYMERLNPLVGGFVRKITKFYFDFHWNQEKIIGCVINDPLAVLFLINPHLFTGFFAYTSVTTQGECIGQSVVDRYGILSKKKNSFIAEDVDAYGAMIEIVRRIVEMNDIEDVFSQIYTTQEPLPEVFE